MASDIIRAEVRVTRWLRGEHRYQFAKNDMAFESDPEQSLDNIMGREIVNKWGRYLQARKDRPRTSDPKYLEYSMRASQMILKTTAAARAATIWKEVASAETGTSADSAFETSSGRTWEHLSTYFNKLASDSGQLPDRTLLDRPLEDAIAPHTIERGDDGYTPLPVFTSLAGLAVVHLIEQQGDTQSMKLPQPGVSSGNIMPWGTQALLT